MSKQISTKTTIRNLTAEIKKTFVKKDTFTPVQTAANAAIKSLEGCCGDTSDLLAEYLAQHDIYTYYVCGQKGTQSHAWLVLVNTVTVTTDNSDADRKYKSLISVYNEDNDVMLLRKYYNLKDAIIIDITGDQFTNQKCFLYYNIPVYVGFLDDFHKLFRVDQCSIHEPARLWDARCKSLYRAITKYIK